MTFILIRNFLSFEGSEERKDELLKFIQNEDGEDHEIGVGTIDFNKIIPMPKEVEIAEKQRSEYGHDWRVSNWGSDINGKDCFYIESKNQIAFLTLECGATKIVAKLSEIFPDVKLTHEWAEEGISSRCGKRVHLGGNVIEEYYPETENDIIEFSCSIWGYNPERLCFVRNASGNSYINTVETKYELITVLEKPALFSNKKLTTSDIAEGLYVYHLRASDTNNYATIEPNLIEDCTGSIITSEPLAFSVERYIDITDEENSINFCGCEVSMQDFMEGKYEQDEGEEIKLC